LEEVKEGGGRPKRSTANQRFKGQMSTLIMDNLSPLDSKGFHNNHHHHHRSRRISDIAGIGSNFGEGLYQLVNYSHYKSSSNPYIIYVSVE